MRPRAKLSGAGTAEFHTLLNGDSIMRKATKIAVAVGAALSLGLAAAELSAHPTSMGWGGYGPGSGMHGYGMGSGMGPGAGMGYGMHGYGMGSGMGSGAGMGYGMHGYGMGFGAHPEAVENRLASLRSELGITAKQEPAWQAFVDNANKQAENRQAWLAKLREAQIAGTAPELLAQQAEIARQRQVELESTATALQSLYAVLTPEQKAVADRAFGGFGPGYRGGAVGRVR
jgi:hypothetical protein